MRRCFLIASVVVAGFVRWDADADVIRVPEDQPTIQAGIDAASDGDEVLVADGVYTGSGNRNLDFGGRVIVVRSEGGAANCVIDCQRLGRGFVFDDGEPVDAVVAGFTIRNGVTNRALGGGIYCPSASPTIRDCVIEDNDTGLFNGAGLYVGPGTEPRIVNCIIRNNRGGGGAGIHCDGSSALLINCAIMVNEAGVGGGTLCTGGSPTFVNCLFARNVAPDVNWGGGAIFCNAGSTARFINCTLAYNLTFGSGGALYSNRSSAPVFTNSILYSNMPDEIFLSGSSGDPVITYSDVSGSWPGIGNLDVDPMFVDSDSDDFRLSSPDSRCIDAGNNAAIPPDLADLDDDDDTDEPTPLDLVGGPRRVDDPAVEDIGEGFAPLVDMGAYEFPAGSGGCVRDPEWQCDGDVDGDGQVNPVDSGLVQAAFSSTDEQDLCNYDVDCDGQINPVDSGIVQSLFGTCDAPRGVCP